MNRTVEPTVEFHKINYEISSPSVLFCPSFHKLTYPTAADFICHRTYQTKVGFQSSMHTPPVCHDLVLYLQMADYILHRNFCGKAHRSCLLREFSPKLVHD